jgi:hypothetical protein
MKITADSITDGEQHLSLVSVLRREEEKRSNETSPDEWRLWAAIQLGELLAANSRTPTPPTVESPDQILISILSRMDRVVIKKVCNLLQVESYEFGGWRKWLSVQAFP